MRKLLLAVTLSLYVAGCATLPNGQKVFLPTASVANPVTPMSLYDIKATYAIAQAGADAYIQRYRDGHRCTKTALESVTNLCSRRSIVLKMQMADSKAQVALGQVDTFIMNNPTLDASSAIAAAQLAVNAFYTIQQGNP
jgi:hypothetical protein